MRGSCSSKCSYIVSRLVDPSLSWRLKPRKYLCFTSRLFPGPAGRRFDSAALSSTVQPPFFFFSIVSFDFLSDALHHVFHVGTDGVNFKLSKSAWLTIEEEEHWSLTFRAFDRMLSIHRALSYVHFWSRNASDHKV